MARILDAFSKFFDGNGQPLVGGYAKFFINETTIAADTFDDPEETIVNPAKVPFNADGGLSLNAYGSILMTVKIYDSSDSQVSSEDNVTPRGGLTSGFAYANWLSSVTYVPFISIVTGSDNNYYTPLQTNAGQDPVVDFGGPGLFWKRINLNEFWVVTVNYNVGARVISPTNLKRYICVTSNAGNDPVSDATGVNWELDEAILNFAIGKSYAVGNKCFDEIDSRIYIAQTAQSGNQPSSDGGTNWLPADGIVTKPTNASPADLAEDVSRTPVLTGDSYAVSGSSVVHKYSRFEVYSDVGLATLVYKSDITSDLESHIVSVPLNRATTYYWRVAYSGERAGTSLFSDATSFSTVPDLSEIFAINSDAGSAGTRTAVTGIDLVTDSGSIWTKNRNTTDFLKRLDTQRNLKELDLSEETAEVTNVNGLQQYFANGFEVGTDSGYNGAGDIISSYIFKNFPGFHATVTYTGNSTDRDISHPLGVPATAYIVKNISSNIPGDSDFWFKHSEISSDGALPMSGSTTLTAGLLGGSTSTTFNVQSHAKVNTTGDTYLCELFADNPNMGITGGKYTGTGSAGLEITPGFKPGLFITVANTFTVGVRGTHIADIKTGTSSHIYISNTGAGNAEVAGSVASWDNDKIVLDSNSLNASGVVYYYIIIQDPS
ncbi:MAG TPA: hypothetical protein EYN54_06015 [Methylococcaceae bacterium]|nr:hypothetical protein [Methylococcaceae bacterium]